AEGDGHAPHGGVLHAAGLLVQHPLSGVAGDQRDHGERGGEGDPDQTPTKRAHAPLRGSGSVAPPPGRARAAGRAPRGRETPARRAGGAPTPLSPTRRTGRRRSRTGGSRAPAPRSRTWGAAPGSSSSRADLRATPPAPNIPSLVDAACGCTEVTGC